MPGNPEQTFTSTGSKYARNFHMIQALREGRGAPQSLQVSVTNACNLACVFCSTDERELKQKWAIGELAEAISMFREIGIKTVEFSGGGDPTLYKELPEIVACCRSLGLKMGMITNGIKLKDLPRETLESLSWVRVSMVSLDYVKTVELPQPWPKDTMLGMSYVVGQIDYNGTSRRYNDSDLHGLSLVKEYADRYGASYVRVVPDCYTPGEEAMRALQSQWEPIVQEIGPPLFLQHKFQLQATKCWMDSTKPWLDTSGYLFPCNSLTLCTQAHRKFDMKWALCHWRDAKQYYQNRGSASLPFVADLCDRCTFTRQANEMESLLTPLLHEEFV